MKALKGPSKYPDKGRPILLKNPSLLAVVVSTAPKAPSFYCRRWPSSKVIIKFLIVMQKHGYIGEFEYVDDHRSGKIVVELNGRLNKCGVISPRFDVGVKEIEGWTARLLPSRQFGYIVLTTSAGIMDHEEARRKNVGGKGVT
ncbi:hypothetical protein K7X08_004765 [Anisodus acutangulus]|uniref:Small ribosomal subunit protein uS8c n=1 Tax=Anisodus acutangulus TaxID=402998 RepID=A0A9Q1RIG3_9SOLA|nr:hypothetical protein K7X08_004765 [Anisodus acutangulus]